MNPNIGIERAFRFRVSGFLNQLLESELSSIAATGIYDVVQTIEYRPQAVTPLGAFSLHNARYGATKAPSSSLTSLDTSSVLCSPSSYARRV